MLFLAVTKHPECESDANASSSPTGKSLALLVNKRTWLVLFLKCVGFCNKLNKIFLLLSKTAGELSNKIGAYQAAEVCRRPSIIIV